MGLGAHTSMYLSPEIIMVKKRRASLTLRGPNAHVQYKKCQMKKGNCNEIIGLIKNVYEGVRSAGLLSRSRG